MSQIARRKAKLVFLGDEGVGKTSIIAKYMYDDFDSKYHTTIGIDFFSKSIISDEFITRLQIWDTAGQERFRSLIPSYIRDASIAIIVYDVTNGKSFENIAYWIELLETERRISSINNDMSIVLVGNKCDLINENENKNENKNNKSKIISKLEGSEKAKELNIPFFQVSAKNGRNIKEMFEKSIECYVDKQTKKIKESKNESENNQSNVDLENSETTNQSLKSTLSQWCCFEWMNLI